MPENQLAPRLAVILVTLLLAAFLPGLAGRAAESLAGPAFGDPTYVLPLEPGAGPEKIQAGAADLVVALNHQLDEFLIPYIKRYGEEHGLHIEIKEGTCGVSAGMLVKKKGDIGAFCCPPGNTDRLPGLQFHTVGIYPLAILVHADNPLENLPLATIRKIFRGEIIRWSELGWADKNIQAVVRLHCKNRPGHWRLLLDNEDLFRPDARGVGAIEDMLTLVAAQPAAIGYEALRLSRGQAGKMKALQIDGISPADEEALVSGRYPLYRTLNLTTWAAGPLRRPHSLELVEYLIGQVEKDGTSQGIVPAVRLQKAGWQFRGAELVGAPRR